MQYLLLIYVDEAAMAAASPDDVKKINPAYAAYNKAMIEAGVLRAGERLKPSNTATQLRLRDGKTQVLDGPYADTKEQLGGYYLIEAPDIDAAISWAARCPSAANGTIEVRPIWPVEM